MNSKPTVYKGVRYRSLTEARWAAFLEHINLSFVYEPEMFELATCRYIPDFFLQRQKVWLEIKGCEDEIDPCKYLELASATRFPLFCICGSPRPGRYWVGLFPPHRAYPRIDRGLFAQHKYQAGWWIADKDACTPFRISGRRETGSTSDLVIHTPQLIGAMEQAFSQFDATRESSL